ncbi:glycoside hydrolase family 9 protein [Myxococcota bacterium]|nr:glycoside hydrolase family 9 protein [Myxococcota bacterium]
MNRLPNRVCAILVLLWACVLPPGEAEAKGPASPAPLDPRLRTDGPAPLAVPPVGAWEVRAVSQRVLQVLLVQTAAPDRWPESWDFAREGSARLPPASSFQVTVQGRTVAVTRVGFRRRPVFGPRGRRDLRLESVLTLHLASDLPDRGEALLANPGGEAWARDRTLRATLDLERPSPAIHPPDGGFHPREPKRIPVGLWLGSSGELPIPEGTPFQVRNERGEIVLHGHLAPRRERGFEDMTPPYREVREADLTALTAEGTYRLSVPGLGTSRPFRVHRGAAARLARTLALGLHHQRCGTALEMPWTRFVHGTCHPPPVLVPPDDDPFFRDSLEGLSEDRKAEPGEAPVLDRPGRALFPAVRRGPRPIFGGHHDAGDYGRYTSQGAALVHALVLAVDALPGVADLDDLGLPESGDGVPDLLQEAAWEADFLLRMQDEDGGFFSMIRPRGRAYEDDVPPDPGDPQMAWPKNTSSTAAAVAALAQAGSSPVARRHLPAKADAWLQAARKGWSFLEEAWKRHGARGAYQRVFHYGDFDGDADEAAWAAMEMLLATGEDRFARFLQERGFVPTDARRFRKWQWVPLTEGYGNATRSCALSGVTGRPGRSALPPSLGEQCRKEMDTVGDELASWSLASAYGTSFPLEAKRHRTAAWYFSAEQAFDLELAAVGRRRPDLQEAALANQHYTLGANPVDVCFLTGLGARRPRNIVHQWTLNDWRRLPMAGILVGDVTAGFSWTPEYGRDLGRLIFPPDGDRETRDPYAWYDRYGDVWNVQTESTVVAQARALAAAAARMARLRTLDPGQAKDAPPEVRIEGLVPRMRPGQEQAARVRTGGCPEPPEILWEVEGQEPSQGPDRRLKWNRPGRYRVEVEGLCPDGRRGYDSRQVEVAEPPATTGTPP